MGKAEEQSVADRLERLEKMAANSDRAVRMLMDNVADLIDALAIMMDRSETMIRAKSGHMRDWLELEARNAKDLKDRMGCTFSRMVAAMNDYMNDCVSAQQENEVFVSE